MKKLPHCVPGSYKWIMKFQHGNYKPFYASIMALPVQFFKKYFIAGGLAFPFRTGIPGSKKTAQTSAMTLARGLKSNHCPAKAHSCEPHLKTRRNGLLHLSFNHFTLLHRPCVWTDEILFPLQTPRKRKVISADKFCWKKSCAHNFSDPKHHNKDYSVPPKNLKKRKMLWRP